MVRILFIGLYFLSNLPLSGQELTESEKQHVIDKVSRHLEKHYILQQEGRKMAQSLVENSKNGKYETIRDRLSFSNELTEDMRSIFPDKHLGLIHKQWAQKKRDSIESIWIQSRYKILETRLLDNKIGYLRISSFTFKSSDWDKAMEKLDGCEKLIIDIRNDGGGNGKLEKYALSYFLPEGLHYSTTYNRNGKAIKNLSKRHIKGKRKPDITLFILIDHQTFSAAEGFAYQLQSQGRATVIGELSSGGAHPKRNILINDYFYLSLPILRVENSKTHADWEGIGVKPDKTVKPELALDEAIKEAKGN